MPSWAYVVAAIVAVPVGIGTAVNAQDDALSPLYHWSLPMSVTAVIVSALAFVFFGLPIAWIVWQIAE